MTKGLFVLLIATVLFAEEPTSLTPQDHFWKAFQALCGHSYEGQITIDNGKNKLEGLPRIEVQHCSEREMRILFQIGDDRSRTWILTRTGSGLRLKHDHRHADGSPDKITNYGGDTYDVGQPTRQEFDVDQETVNLIPGTDKHQWVFEIHAGKVLAYELYRGGASKPGFRVELALSVD